MSALAPDIATAVIGYRRWAVRDGSLWPPHAADVWAQPWTPGVNRAYCAYARRHRSEGRDPERWERGYTGQHTAPGEHCDCGLYAWSEPALCEPDPESVLGLVRLWGQVHVAAQAIRAEYAEIVALTGDPGVAERYGVPLTDRYGLELHALAYDAMTIPELHGMIEQGESNA